MRYRRQHNVFNSLWAAVAVAVLAGLVLVPFVIVVPTASGFVVPVSSPAPGGGGGIAKTTTTTTTSGRVRSTATTTSGHHHHHDHHRHHHLFVLPRRQQQQQQQTQKAKTNNPLQRIIFHWNTIQPTGLTNVRFAGAGGRGSSGSSDRPLIQKVHSPITYLVLALLAGLKWDWCFRSPYYWFGVAFCIKWYRARYVFKIPVWDRQPNWNNIITSKEQEKDLKAFTCKNCGSTLFIAKSREFFFEGGTGIGGLGCFSCGAKGKDNFVMDRDRIVEDVADVDDYFEYERPLDFVSAAERRKLLKESGGDEDKANLLLLERTTGIKSADTTSTTSPASSSTSNLQVVEAEIVETTETQEKESTETTKAEAETSEEDKPEPTLPPPPSSTTTSTTKQQPKPKPSLDDDDLDLLGMDG